jgi:hypothetical protein
LKKPEIIGEFLIDKNNEDGDVDLDETFIFQYFSNSDLIELFVGFVRKDKKIESTTRQKDEQNSLPSFV